ncbi:MAG TPA: hypothetical protein VMV10_22555 [Pirellulales bacterium]|nr:hypothetical protein [Pirellulales bacterium]
MGIHHEYGYSADVEGFFVIRGNRVRLAKTNGRTFVLAEPCELPPGSEGDLLTIVDGKANSRRVLIPEGVCQGQTIVKYVVAAPF